VPCTIAHATAGSLFLVWLKAFNLEFLLNQGVRPKIELDKGDLQAHDANCASRFGSTAASLTCLCLQDDLDEAEKTFKRERSGGNYGIGTKEVQEKNYVAVSEQRGMPSIPSTFHWLWIKCGRRAFCPPSTFGSVLLPVLTLQFVSNCKETGVALCVPAANVYVHVYKCAEKGEWAKASRIVWRRPGQVQAEWCQGIVWQCFC